MNDSKKLRILIVDDDDIIRETYRQVFQERGFEAVGAKDGVEGIDLATKDTFDAIMTGIVMPRMDGFQLIEALRENVSTKDIPIVIMSHLGREEDRRKARELGIDNFIIQGSMPPREITDMIRSITSANKAYQLSFDHSAWDAPILAKKLNLQNFECPNCHNRLILELSPKADGKGFDAFFKCPKCDLNL